MQQVCLFSSVLVDSAATLSDEYYLWRPIEEVRSTAILDEGSAAPFRGRGSKMKRARSQPAAGLDGSTQGVGRIVAEEGSSEIG